MKIAMTQEEFTQWSRLTHAVVRRCFWWAYRTKRERKDDGEFGRFQCSLDYDDLISEGHLALMDAWHLYEEEYSGNKASFKTYAYKSICNRVGRYVDANISQMTTKDWKRARGDEGREDLKAAVGCMLFSDMAQDRDRLSEWQFMADKKTPRPDQEVEKSEWEKTCIDELRKYLGKRRTTVLLRWTNGATLNQIGKTLGVTKEWARILINEWMVVASAILADRERDQLDK